jgi:ABC-2 type transport system permease protein
MSSDVRPVTKPAVVHQTVWTAPPRGSWIRETWWLVAARWRIAVNSVRRGARWRLMTYAIVALAVLFLGFVALMMSYALTMWIERLTAPDRSAVDVIPATILSATLSLSILVSFTVALAALYLSADLDLLLSAPVSRRAVFASKLIGGLLPSHILILLMALVPLMGHGMALGYGASYYLAVILALLLLPLIPMAVGAIAVMLIVRHVSAHRLGDIVALVVGAMTLSIAFVAGGARQLQDVVSLAQILEVFEKVRTPYSPAEWLTRALVATGNADWPGAARWFLFAAVASLVIIVPAMLLAEKLYYSGWQHIHAGSRRREMQGSRLPWNRVDRASSLSRPSGVLRFLSPPTVAIVRKDFRVIPRDLTNMAQVLSPLAIGVFFVLQRLLYPVRLGGLTTRPEVIDPLLAMLSAGVAAAVGSMIMSRFCLTAFSIEGRSFWIVRSAPVRNREIVVGKFLVAYLPYLVLGGALVLLLEVARAFSDARAIGGLSIGGTIEAFDPWLALYAWFAVSVVGAGVLAINLALGSSRPNMRWDTPHEMLTPDVGCLSLVLYGGYGVIATMALLIPAATSGFPVVTSSTPLWIFGLGLGLGLTAAVVGTSLALAVHEAGAISD